jgi:hypothetical protein
MSSFRSRSGGKLNGEDVQPIVQILTQPALTDGFFGVEIRRSNHADVDGLLARSAERPERALLQTRNSFAWVMGVISAISSRNSVPRCASSNAPARRAMAPVNAPFSWPKSSDSSSVSGWPRS